MWYDTKLSVYDTTVLYSLCDILLFPWQGLGTDNAMLDLYLLAWLYVDTVYQIIVIVLHGEKMPIKTVYWFHINKLKETKSNSSFTLTILIFWDTN